MGRLLVCGLAHVFLLSSLLIGLLVRSRVFLWEGGVGVVGALMSLLGGLPDLLLAGRF